MRHELLYTDEDNNWIANVPSLPSCHSDGRTREEAIERVKEAIEVYVEALFVAPFSQNYISRRQ